MCVAASKCSKPRCSPDEAFACESVLDESGERIEERLEVRLADQCGSVAVVVQHRRNARRIDGQCDAVHPHAVRAGMLAGDDRRPRRHAHDGLRMGAFVADALRGETVDHRSSGDDAAVATQRVVALLIGGDEQDLAAHQRSPSSSSDSICRASSSSAPAVAPPMVNAIARGSAVGRVDDQACLVAEVDDIDHPAVVGERRRP